ncbi:hypothetical protein, partial [Thermoflexus sp.]|uniref:hypothetical protein n=1 Tax=Thermoflexus sp. TaxID=1969742 RepID=UPI003C05BF7A
PEYDPLEKNGWVRRELKAARQALVVPRAESPQREKAARKKTPQKENIWVSPRLARRLGVFRSQTFFDLLENPGPQGDAR